MRSILANADGFSPYLLCFILCLRAYLADPLKSRPQAPSRQLSRTLTRFSFDQMEGRNTFYGRNTIFIIACADIHNARSSTPELVPRSSNFWSVYYDINCAFKLW